MRLYIRSVTHSNTTARIFYETSRSKKDKTSQSMESCLDRRRGVNVEMGKILKLNWELVDCSIVSNAPQKAKKVRTELARRIRHEPERSKAGQALIRREVFG